MTDDRVYARVALDARCRQAVPAGNFVHGSKGLSKVKRAEFLARLEALEHLIREQETRIALTRARGWDAKESERRLELLRESHHLYRSALVHLLGDDFSDAERDG